MGCPPGVPPPNGGKGVPPPNGGNFVRLCAGLCAGFKTTPEGERYTSLAVWFMISPIPMILFSSLFISMTRIFACGGIFL